MVAIDMEALLIVENALLVLLQQFVGLSEVEKGTRLGSLLAVVDLDDQGSLQHLDCLLSFPFLHENFTFK